ncbi:hypothetical protein [Streptosporangium carneum]|uniref:Uncharacterized protein n=1 Tax=Streptosporangium carneum TaxID=47481 RepID=A0A9W6HXD2_9ACTN|nr:hypothetical protein [Streptosporangium carneum]GLK08041.1 hypothetical protein GCM10017600_14460 [Streptosporangium carneum]
MFALGFSWLVLAPLCLWLLLRGRGSVRLGGVFALVGLEAATIWVSGSVHAGPWTVGTVEASPHAGSAQTSPHAYASAQTSPHVNGFGQAASPVPSAAVLPVTAPATPGGTEPGGGMTPGGTEPGGGVTPAAGRARGRATACATRLPVPERVSLRRRDGELRALTFFWEAMPDECGTVTAVVRRANRGVRVWLHEGPVRHRPADARVLPVNVAGGVASTRVRLTPAPAAGAFEVVDGRSGRPIAPMRPTGPNSSSR